MEFTNLCTRLILVEVAVARPMKMRCTLPALLGIINLALCFLKWPQHISRQTLNNTGNSILLLDIFTCSPTVAKSRIPAASDIGQLNPGFATVCCVEGLGASMGIAEFSKRPK